MKHAKGFGQVVGGFLGAFDYWHRNFHLSNEKQSPTSPPNFLGTAKSAAVASDSFKSGRKLPLDDRRR